MKFRTVKAVQEALQARGGYLEKLWDSELPEYAPHLHFRERGWDNGVYTRYELLAWADENLA